ncbi:MAG TPA: response regulator [Polyangiaceae bacterium]|jgi:CheY-like chemotaxis protein
MAKVTTVNLDASRVEGVLSKSTRRVTCREAADASSILARAGAAAPDLVVLGGEAAAAADVAEAMIDDPALQRTPLVAWGVRGSLADTSRLVALGVRVVTGDEDALRAACEEALDAREGRTIRVDAPTELEGGKAEEPDLHGRRVVVADDDPAITWFFADLLRAQGCDVEEACDGEAALDRARRTVPDLVISDIRMPRLDGVNLCRALRADPILADVPIVLLSWKEDWLRQAEGGGVEASAYLAKRSTPEEVLMRVHEVLEPHARLERRMRKPGPVRGRLDGTAPYRLLRLACATRADARLTLRCAPNTYEVRIRDGAPRSAARLTADGAVLHGVPALASLLGERAGRFTLNAERAPIDPDLTGSLHQQIAAVVARSRGLASAPRIVVPAELPAPPSAPASTRASIVAPRVLEISVEEGPVEHAPEPPARTLPLPPRPFAPRLVTVTPRAAVERTLPLARPAVRYIAAPTPLPAIVPSTVPSTVPRAPRSWGIPLRWVGVAAVAALGLVLGAGVRALRQTPAPSPRTAAVAVPQR